MKFGNGSGEYYHYDINNKSDYANVYYVNITEEWNTVDDYKWIIACRTNYMNNAYLDLGTLDKVGNFLIQL